MTSERPDWVRRVAVLACVVAPIAVVALVVFVWASLGQHDTNAPEWDDVDDAIDDWVIDLPHLGQPLFLSETVGLRGNGVLLRLRVPHGEILAVLRALHVNEVPRPCPATADTNDMRCAILTGFDSRADGHKYPWLAGVKMIHADANAATLEIDAWQEYD